MKEVMFYQKGEGGVANCKLCPRLCNIKPGKRGYCRVRKNEEGVLYAENYGQCSSYGMDPIEKKPLYHFYPGSQILSLGTVGCNLHCGFCQNWTIAHGDPPLVEISPEDAVQGAIKYRDRGCVGLAYTYSEPFMWYEYVYDTAILARKSGFSNVLVTNGYVSEEPLLEILPHIDAMNIDVKGFTEEYYRSSCLGRLGPVKRTVELSYDRCHVEITTLLVPGLNDSPEEIGELARWVADMNPDMPLHLSRYFPNYKFDLPPTSLDVMERAREIASRHLNYVYLGNAPELDGGSTRCPDCDNSLIIRKGYQTSVPGIEKGRCRECGREVNVIS